LFRMLLLRRRLRAEGVGILGDGCCCCGVVEMMMFLLHVCTRVSRLELSLLELSRMIEQLVWSEVVM
jgi:hypothetical protein